LEAKVIGTYNYAEFSYPSIYSALKIVDSFSSKKKLELIVVSKSSREQTERERNQVMHKETELYKNILGENANIIAGDSYKVAGESRLIICDQSALGYELLGMGCKVVFLNFIAYFLRQPSYRFGWPLELPDQGPFWSSIPDPDYVESMLEKIWNMPRNEWEEVARPYREKLMAYDKGNEILHQRVKAVLDF
jgi:surface carbohydrate biosynthesis protein